MAESTCQSVEKNNSGIQQCCKYDAKLHYFSEIS